MKKALLFALLCIGLGSCKITQIGDFTMLSTRNVNDHMDYCLKKSYVNDTRKEIKKNRSKTVDEAVDKVVKNVPGGEFLRNVRVYHISGFKKDKYSVVGDVWGYCTENTEHKGFAVGDNVIWKEGVVYQKGRIESIKNGNECIIITESGDYRTVNFRKLSKTSDSQ